MGAGSAPSSNFTNAHPRSQKVMVQMAESLLPMWETWQFFLKHIVVGKGITALTEYIIINSSKSLS